MDKVERGILRIRTFAKMQGWKPIHLARKARLHQNTLRKIDDPGWNPSLYVLRKLEAIIPDEFQLPGGQGSGHHNDNAPKRIGEITPGIVASLPQFARLCEHLHRLGPRSVGELLIEVANAEVLMEALQRYERLDPETVHAIGADQFPPSPLTPIC